jgi:hypothetical protein
MGKSSIHISPAVYGSIQHNSREKPSHSVVFPNEMNECTATSAKAYTVYRELLRQRQAAYSRRVGQKMQKKTVTKMSAVVNLKKYHTLADLKPLISYIEKTFDTVVYQAAIHRDEGKLVHMDGGWELYSGEDFFRNQKDGELYYDKKYTEPVDMSLYKIEKN